MLKSSGYREKRLSVSHSTFCVYCDRLSDTTRFALMHTTDSADVTWHEWMKNVMTLAVEMMTSCGVVIFRTDFLWIFFPYVQEEQKVFEHLKSGCPSISLQFTVNHLNILRIHNQNSQLKLKIWLKTYWKMVWIDKQTLLLKNRSNRNKKKVRLYFFNTIHVVVNKSWINYHLKVNSVFHGRNSELKRLKEGKVGTWTKQCYR